MDRPGVYMPPACDDLAILRVCVRGGFSRDLASLLLTDLQRALSRVERLAGHLSGPVAPRSITGIPALGADGSDSRATACLWLSRTSRVAEYRWPRAAFGLRWCWA